MSAHSRDLSISSPRHPASSHNTGSEVAKCGLTAVRSLWTEKSILVTSDLPVRSVVLISSGSCVNLVVNFNLLRGLCTSISGAGRLVWYGLENPFLTRNLPMTSAMKSRICLLFWSNLTFSDIQIKVHLTCSITEHLDGWMLLSITWRGMSRLRTYTGRRSILRGERRPPGQIGRWLRSLVKNHTFLRTRIVSEFVIRLDKTKYIIR